MTSPNLSDLIERVEAATGPDENLDREIMLAVGYIYEQRDIGCRYEDGSVALDWVYYDPQSDDNWWSTHPRRFTGSVDDALALSERNGWLAHLVRWRVNYDDSVMWEARVDSYHDGVLGEFYGRAAWRPNAITAASLRALQEKDIDHG